MTHRILENGIVRDALPDEVAEIETRIVEAQKVKPAPAPTKEQLMAELAALTAKINAME
jgi:hypothetical protein